MLKMSKCTALAPPCMGVEGALRKFEYKLERKEDDVELLEEVNLSKDRTTLPDFLGIVSKKHGAWSI
jgi:hypothetical protein